MKSFVFGFLGLLFACTHSQKKVDTTGIVLSQDTHEKIKPQYSLGICESEDSLERAFMNGEYYFSSFIRLKSKGSAFIFIESDYFDSVATDTRVKELFDSTTYIFSNNREAYYAQIISALPQKDLNVHEMVWSLPEMISQGQNGDGGMYTLATWIVQKPSVGDPYYYIEVRRNYYFRFCIYSPISYIKIHEKTQDIFVMDTQDTWEYISIKDWRALQKKNQAKD